LKPNQNEGSVENAAKKRGRPKNAKKEGNKNEASADVENKE
jgi:hypothetical protein